MEREEQVKHSFKVHSSQREVDGFKTYWLAELHWEQAEREEQSRH